MPFVEAFVGEGEGEREEIIAGGLAEEGDDGGAVDAAAEKVPSLTSATRCEATACWRAAWTFSRMLGRALAGGAVAVGGGSQNACRSWLLPWQRSVCPGGSDCRPRTSVKGSWTAP